MRESAKKLISYSEHARKLLHPRLRHDKVYHVVVVDDALKKKFFRRYCEEVVRRKWSGVCVLDFEFNGKQAATVQMNIEVEDESEIFIFVFNPALFDDYYFVDALLTNKRFSKVLHGGDSLDTPYLSTIMTRDQMKRFLERLIDTRFLCAFADERCGIYTMLHNNDIIGDATMRKLEENEARMGKIYDIHIDVRDLDPHLLRYAVYDVIFLGYMVAEYKRHPLYRHWCDLIRASYMEKRKVIDASIFEDRVALWNVARLHNNVSLFELFTQWWEKHHEAFEAYIRCGFVRRMVMRIVKYVFYCHIAATMKVYASLRNGEELRIRAAPSDITAAYPSLGFLVKKIEEKL